MFAVHVDSGMTREVCRIPNGQFNSMNADDTLLLGFVAYGSAPEWIGHTQFSPTDPNQIIFSHEGPCDRVDRMWAIRADGSGLRKLHERSMNFEIFGHEWFSPDGKQVHYDLQTPRGQVFWVASVDLESGRRVYRRVERDQWSVHFNASPHGTLFAGDGGDADHTPPTANGWCCCAPRPSPMPTPQIIATS